MVINTWQLDPTIVVSDKPKQLSAGRSTTASILSDSGGSPLPIVTPDLTAGNIFTWSMVDGARTLGNPTNVGAGVWYIFATVVGSGSPIASATTLSFDTYYNIVSGVFDTTVNAVNIFKIVCDGSNNYDVYIDQRP